MAVNWQWNNKRAEICFGNEQESFKLAMYEGNNCLAVMLYEYNKDEQGRFTYDFNGWAENVKEVVTFVKERSEWHKFLHIEKVSTSKRFEKVFNALQKAGYVVKDKQRSQYYGTNSKNKTITNK